MPGDTVPAKRLSFVPKAAENFEKSHDLSWCAAKGDAGYLTSNIEKLT
jgi:uncharacterized protein (DUF427 family)